MVVVFSPSDDSRGQWRSAGEDRTEGNWRRSRDDDEQSPPRDQGEGPGDRYRDRRGWVLIVSYVTGFAKRDHIPHFYKIFNFCQFLRSHILTTISEPRMLLGTVQVLPFN